MTTPIKRVLGRPPLAAQSLDAAVQAVLSGSAPSRPRNQHERDAQRRTRGRKPAPQCKTRQAALLASYWVRGGEKTLCNAVRDAAADYGINRDNVRKYTNRLIRPKLVRMEHNSTPGAASWAPKPAARLVPFVVSIEDGEAVEDSTD